MSALDIPVQMVTMTKDSDASDSSRRTVLKTLAAAGVAGAGITGASGSVAAQSQGNGRRVLRNIEVATDLVDDAGDTVAEFEGQLSITEILFDEETGELLAGGTLRGTVDQDGETNRIGE